MPAQDPNPRISWWKRRKYDKRANARRGALAQALPAPDPVTRVDVHGNPAPLADRWPPGAGPGARRSSVNEVSAVGADTSVNEPERDTSAHTRRPSAWGVAGLCWLSAVGVLTLVGVGLPLLGHSTRWMWVAAGGVTALLFAWLAYEPLSKLSVKGAVAAAGVPAVFTALFTLGAVSNPVIVDGQVQPSWSSTAQSYRFAEQMRSDLSELADMDALMGADNTQAWARRADIESSISRAESLGLEYQERIDSGDLPSGEFLNPTGHLADAAYAAGRSLTLRLNLLDTSDETGLLREFEEARGVYQVEWTAAATGLGTALDTLGLPVPGGS